MKELCLIIWMALTILLVFSVIGMLLFIPKDTWQNAENVPSTWMTIGRRLLNSVTLANNAGTTVTTQPNFRYRVIDSNLFEIDGVIIVRSWRDAARTADTLNVAPFLHFVDCHYQSTQMSTKTKNYPFYT